MRQDFMSTNQQTTKDTKTNQTSVRDEDFASSRLCECISASVVSLGAVRMDVSSYVNDLKRLCCFFGISLGLNEAGALDEMFESLMKHGMN